MGKHVIDIKEVEDGTYSVGIGKHVRFSVCKEMIAQGNIQERIGGLCEKAADKILSCSDEKLIEIKPKSGESFTVTVKEIREDLAQYEI